ncbi:hypothetical protein CVT24_001623 [Panaeolus cyanescens]|uniref:Protein kinase domain-containing protein n=1 Tax=Panaeolus cyanescens TaxID=181874 RepID=A0A409YF52_9AGAR|nr:hypothetical protein CVT24_001623 [Panaeolus cyanescens]
MDQKQWLDSLNLPDGAYKNHLEDIFQPKGEHPFRLPWDRCDAYEFKPHPPLRIEDVHMSRELTLMHVCHIPSLLGDLQKEFQQQFEEFLKKGVPKTEATYLPKSEEYWNPIMNLDCVSGAYIERVGWCSLSYSSRMHLLPDSDRWMKPLSYYGVSAPEIFMDEMMVCATEDASHLAIPDFGLEEETARLINPSTAEKLDASRRRNAALAMFTFYPPNEGGETIINQCCNPDVAYTFPSADGYNLPRPESTSNLITSSDWLESFWEEYVKKVPTCAQPTRPSNVRKKMVWIPGPCDERKDLRNYTPVVSHFVQRAWNAAVEHDATFLLISCGSKERICIRHRRTNTLFVSDIIAADADDYVMTQLAFYSAFTRDLLAREPYPKPSGKRKLQDDTEITHSPVKRPDHSQTPQTDPGKNSKTFDQEMANRPVILLTFDMGMHRSTTPSTFLRQRSSCTPLPVCESFEREMGGRECPVTKCVYLKLYKILGEGTEGITYTATATLHLESGLTIQKNVVIKIAKMPYITGHLKNEYNMYWKLAMAGVSEGILKVYGKEELLSRIGRFWEKKKVAEPRQFYISDDEYASLKRTVVAINGTGIIHNDVKINNILFDEDGRPYIIDFGLAEVWKYGKFEPETLTQDPPCSIIDPERLRTVEASILSSPNPRSYDLQTIEDLYIGRYDSNRRYPGR